MAGGQEGRGFKIVASHPKVPKLENTNNTIKVVLEGLKSDGKEIVNKCFRASLEDPPTDGEKVV